MKKYILSVLALAAIAFVGCEKNDIDDVVVSDVKGQVINFGAGALESRTIYESTDSKQIHWQTGDTIRIYCDKAIGGRNNVQTSGADMAYADYVVTVDESDKSYATIALATTNGNNPLLWGETGVAHKFYAVYPHDAATEVAADGTVTFPINRNQICYIQTADEKTADADASKYTYVARPDMSNAYMVAEQTENPSEFGGDEDKHKNVWLDFKPIMTTINIVVKGPQNLTTEGNPDVNSTADPVVMTGVSVISTITTNTTASKSQFVYDIANAKITGSQTGTGTLSEQTETTFISTRNTDGLDAVTLQQGQTLCLTAFLPPMAAETAKALNRDIQIRVHTTGGNKTMSLEDATVLTPSAKGAIKLPSIYTPITGSNWMTPLDDDIYISQLSIPGTHDSATIYCTDALLGLSESGKCQQLTIADQLKMGIRFFDIRPSGSDLAIYHGLYPCYNSDEDGKTTYKLSDIYGFFNDFLEENPGEFIFVILRYESERVGDSESGFNSAMQTFVETETYTKYALPRDVLDNSTTGLQNLTVGDMRTGDQGRILTIMRPNQGTDPDGYFDTVAPKGMMFISGFPGSNATGTQQAYLKDKYVDYGSDQWGSHTDWIVYCQNYYEVKKITEGGFLGFGATTVKTEEQAVADKLKSVKTYIELATNNTTNAWVINHCSGYRGADAIFSAYAQLAADLNQPVYQYIQNRTPGCLGSILLDFVGTRNWNGYNVYGDLLPQTIIDNNYKYRMKRRGE